MAFRVRTFVDTYNGGDSSAREQFLQLTAVLAEVVNALTLGLSFRAFADGDTTPSVANGVHFRTANTGATIITNLDNGYAGQEVLVVIGDAVTGVDFTGTNLKGNGGADWVPAGANSFMRCVYDGTNWYCQVSD